MSGSLYDRGQEKSLGNRPITSGQDEYYKIIKIIKIDQLFLNVD
jgi:hypothetical protein